LCPRFEPFFAPLVQLAESKIYVQLIAITFDRYLKSSRFSSEALLHRALFMCGIGLNEQLRALDDRDEAIAHQRQTPARFRFIEHGDELDLLAKLQSLEKKVDAEVYGDLVWWAAQRYKEAQARYYNGSSLVAQQEGSQERDPVSNANKSEKAEIAARKRQQAMDRVNSQFKK
jgi:hypothetical protein